MTQGRRPHWSSTAQVGTPGVTGQRRRSGKPRGGSASGCRPSDLTETTVVRCAAEERVAGRVPERPGTRQTPSAEIATPQHPITRTRRILRIICVDRTMNNSQPDRSTVTPTLRPSTESITSSTLRSRNGFQAVARLSPPGHLHPRNTSYVAGVVTTSSDCSFRLGAG